MPYECSKSEFVFCLTLMRRSEWLFSRWGPLRVCLVARVPHLISYMLSTAMWTTYKCVFERVFGRSCEVRCAQLSLCLVARMIWARLDSYQIAIGSLAKNIISIRVPGPKLKKQSGPCEVAGAAAGDRSRRRRRQDVLPPPVYGASPSLSPGGQAPTHRSH
jgi:hypothetical protein